MARRTRTEVPSPDAKGGGSVKKHYVAPVLKKLGSVRELTLGTTTGGLPDTMGGTRPM
jgi:hypothetical protein